MSFATITVSIMKADLTSHEKSRLSNFVLLHAEQRADSIRVCELDPHVSGALLYAMRIVHALLT